MDKPSTSQLVERGTTEGNQYVLRKGVEGYIITHSWSVLRELTEKQREMGLYPQREYKSEEFAFTSKKDAVKKFVEVIG